ncbi:MAG: MBL fold metallo-hydrolase [Firmicutes bacterium]|jgi:glyoxylase-like metal-dependent hydrolase (beta-lactamase superfamily II)|nr:MBL fold metallo-hydrolase [Bacillota bacterium]
MEESKIFEDFEGHDRNRYPYPIYRVTGGMGGEALLILGESKTALYDAGMACFAEQMIENIEAVLERERTKLDYVVLSHTHYDHIGGLPYVLMRWPDVKVYASSKAKQVFDSEGAKATIKRLGEYAATSYGVNDINIIVDNMRVDRVLADGDKIMLGKEQYLLAYETKGHTDCSMSYFLLPEKILITCESTGVLVGPGKIDTSALKDFAETIEVAKRLKKLDIKYLISPHYGVAPMWLNQHYFDMYIQAAREEEAFIQEKIQRDLTFDQVMEAHRKVYWLEGRGSAQPYAAYRINTENIVKQVWKKLV